MLQWPGHVDSWKLSELGLPWFQSPSTLGWQWGSAATRQPRAAFSVLFGLAWVPTSLLCSCLCLWQLSSCLGEPGPWGTQSGGSSRACVLVVIRSDPSLNQLPPLFLPHAFLFLFLDFLPCFAEMLSRSLVRSGYTSCAFPELLHLNIFLTYTLLMMDSWDETPFSLELEACFLGGSSQCPGCGHLTLLGGAAVCTLVFSVSTNFVFGWLFLSQLAVFFAFQIAIRWSSSFSIFHMLVLSWCSLNRASSVLWSPALTGSCALCFVDSFPAQMVISGACVLSVLLVVIACCNFSLWGQYNCLRAVLGLHRNWVDCSESCLVLPAPSPSFLALSGTLFRVMVYHWYRLTQVHSLQQGSLLVLHILPVLTNVWWCVCSIGVSE